MNLLLDMHVFIWAMMAEGRLGSLEKYELLSPENSLMAGEVSFWEIGMKLLKLGVGISGTVRGYSLAS